MRYIIISFIIFFTSNLFPQSSFWFLMDDSDNIIPIVKEYAKRVQDAGGNYIQEKQFNDEIKVIKDNHYLDSLVFWVSPVGGIRKSSDTIQVLFDFKGNDLESSLKYGPLLKDQRIEFTGVNSLQNSTINIPAAFTLLLSITVKDSAEGYIFNSSPGDEFSIFMNKKNELTIQSGKKLKTVIAKPGKNLLILEYNGDASKLYLNNELVASGKLDTNTLQGILLGRNNKNNPDYFSGYLYNCGIFNTIISDNFRTLLFQTLK